MIEIVWVEGPRDRVEVGAHLATAYWRELLGNDEPEYPPPELAWELAGAPGVVDTRLAIAFEDAQPVGAVLQRLPFDQTGSSWLPWLYVDPAARRRGVGRALLGAALALAAAQGRHRMGWRTRADSTAAKTFSRTAGAVVDETLEHNRLLTRTIDKSQLESWVAQRAERGAGYSLVGWDGACPDEHLEGFAALQSVMDLAPGAISELITPTTAATVRANEARWLARGPYWRLCARNDATGELVAFTELQVPDTRPGIADQGDTGVLAPHRERGLGRWLKAVNLLRVLDTRPDVRAIDTTNAADNEPMININREIGFRPVCEWLRWDLRH